MGQGSSSGVRAHMETAQKTGALVLSNRKLTEVRQGVWGWRGVPRRPDPSRLSRRDLALLSGRPGCGLRRQETFYSSVSHKHSTRLLQIFAAFSGGASYPPMPGLITSWWPQTHIGLLSMVTRPVPDCRKHHPQQPHWLMAASRNSKCVNNFNISDL